MCIGHRRPARGFPCLVKHAKFGFIVGCFLGTSSDCPRCVGRGYRRSQPLSANEDPRDIAGMPGARRRDRSLNMLATVASATLSGALGQPVSVEVHVSNGLPGFTIVGLPDAAVRESRDRVRAALLSSGLPWPLRRLTVNLAPSGVRKGGAGLDLAVAVGVLVATGQLPPACTESP